MNGQGFRYAGGPDLFGFAMPLPRVSDAWDEFYWKRLEPAWLWLNRGIRLDAVLGFSAIVATLLAVTFGVPEKQLPPGVSGLYAGVSLLGGALIVLRGVHVFLDSRHDPRASRWAPLMAIVRGQFCLLWALALIQLGQGPLERALSFLATRPPKAWGVVVAMGLFMVIAVRLFRWREEPTPPFVAMAVEPETLGHKPLPSHYRTAVHESGHALLLAGLPHSSRLEMVIRAEEEQVLGEGGHRQLGVVKAAIPDKHVDSEEGLEFRMRLALGGIVAERLVFGQATMGASADQQMWMVLADMYLKNGFGGPYHVSLGKRLSAEQRRANQDALRALHAQHIQEVRTFLAEHLHLVFDMAQKAVEQGTLTQPDLAPFLAKVRLPSGWALDGGDPMPGTELPRQ